MNKTRILLGLILITGAAGALASGTSAFFSDTETSSGNTFTAGAIDLQIDNESYYNGVLNSGTSWTVRNLTIEKFFDFDDIKPNDYGEDTISLHVDTNDAYMCADVTLTSDDDNGINEPEGEAGDTTDGDGNGELADAVQFIWWGDDGDNVLEADEEVISQGSIGAIPLNSTTTVTIADSNDNIWTGNPGPIEGDTTHYIGKAWCFGAIGAAPLAQSGYSGPDADNNGNQTAGEPADGGILCDGSGLGNETQTDSLTADVSFRAVQSRNNSDFQCVPEEEFGACETPTLAFADSVISSDQGVRKNGTPVLAIRSNTASVLGPNQSSGLPSDPAVPAGSFFSLGFNLGTTTGGNIVVEFTDNVIVDGPGNDLQVWEVTGGVYPDEFVKVEVSQDGTNWFQVAASLSRDAQADISSSGLAWAKFVRLTDVTPIGPFEPEADAYDLDAFSALNCGVPLN
jgi:predicted ribosomally synthesized peptide with SipW-like signal peptide